MKRGGGAESVRETMTERGSQWRSEEGINYEKC